MYLTVPDADDYFDSRLENDVWLDADDNQKERAIITAGKYIDRLNFAGDVAATGQEHQFPRGDDTTIPDDVKEACCELAYALLDGIDPELEIENLSMTAQGFGNVRTTYDRTDKPVHILAGIVSVTAWRLLLPYLRDNRSVNLCRVN